MSNNQTNVSVASQTDGAAQWSTLNIALHWLVVALVAFQYFQGEWMIGFFDAGLEGKAMDTATVSFGYLHIATGVAILAAVSVRLWDRVVQGRPPHPELAPSWSTVLARITHAGLYVVLFAMPVVGAITWMTGNEWLGDIHVYGSDVLIVLVALHVLGALVNHFWFKTDILRRMMPARARY